MQKAITIIPCFLPRAQGMGYLQIMARIGSALAPWIADWLVQIHQVLPFAVMGILTIVGAVLALWLPETKDQPTKEVEDRDIKDGTLELQTTDVNGEA